MTEMTEEFADFGDLDIDDIPESIVRGKYRCELSGARLSDVKKEEMDIKLGRKLWVLTFEVSEPNSDYIGESGDLFLNLYTAKIRQDPETKQIMLSDEYLDSTEQQSIRKAVKFYRRIALELGFTKEQIKAGSLDFGTKVGSEYMVTLYPDSKTKKTIVSQNDPITLVSESDDNSSGLNDLEMI